MNSTATTTTTTVVNTFTANLNDRVSVRLTEEGERILTQYFDQQPEQFRENIPVGAYETQLWNLMHIFGPRCFNGAEQVFEKNLLTITELT